MSELGERKCTIVAVNEERTSTWQDLEYFQHRADAVTFRIEKWDVTLARAWRHVNVRQEDVETGHISSSHSAETILRTGSSQSGSIA